MNNVVIANCHICRVKYLPLVIGKPLPGEVVCGSDVAYFEFGSGHDIVIDDDNEPCFGPGKASFLQVSDEVVAQVEERGQRGHYVVTAWTHIKDWKVALEELAKLRLPKPVPPLPVPVLEVTGAKVTTATAQSASAPQVRNNTGRDRRIFHPTIKPVAPQTPTEVCAEALNKLESLPAAELSAECSTAPAPVSTTEQVMKQ